MSDTHLSDISFSHLHLPEVLARGIADAGFERCTPIQAQTLPRALAGFDVAGQAQTGTGKTAAFLVAMYSNLLRKDAPADRPVNAPRALIIAPTRELAVQIHNDAEILGQYTGLSLGLAFGGVDYDKQRRILEDGVDVLIGTPGPPDRLLQAARVRPARDPGRGPRRSRPHVRPRLHHRHPLHPAAPARAGPAAEHAVLGDALAARARARLRAHERPGTGAHRAGQDDRRPRAAGHLLPVDGREAAAAGRPAAADGPAPHDGLRQHAPRRGRAGSPAARPTASMPRPCPATCRRPSACA